MSVQRKRKMLNPVSVIDISEISSGVYYLKLERKVDFIPGQVIALAMQPEFEPRLYSIASGLEDGYIGILFDINPEGELTPLLAALSTGETVFASDPFGKFNCSPDRAVWIATGTGIAPFVSMVRSGRTDNVQLIHGARYLKSFFFSTLFKTELSSDYLRFCTAETGDGVITGRLTDYLRNKDDLSTDIKYYLCGSSQMVIDVREILLSKGIPFDHIIAEIYF